MFFSSQLNSMFDCWFQVNREPLSRTQQTYSDLVEGTEYEYRVLAENEAGISKPSDSTGVFVAKVSLLSLPEHILTNSVDSTKDEVNGLFSSPVLLLFLFFLILLLPLSFLFSSGTGFLSSEAKTHWEFGLHISKLWTLRCSVCILRFGCIPPLNYVLFIASLLLLVCVRYFV